MKQRQPRVHGMPVSKNNVVLFTAAETLAYVLDTTTITPYNVYQARESKLPIEFHYIVSRELFGNFKRSWEKLLVPLEDLVKFKKLFDYYNELELTGEQYDAMNKWLLQKFWNKQRLKENLNLSFSLKRKRLIKNCVDAELRIFPV